MPFRGFISADLPPLPRVDSLVRDLREASLDLKVVSSDHLHVTLKFLGDTQDGLVPEIVAALREAATGVAPMAASVRGTGGFPNLTRPRVIWIGLEGANPLAGVARALDEHLRNLGFAPENRPWSPHVTVARARGPRGLDRVREILRSHEDETFAEVRIKELQLKKSVLRPQGPVYSTVETVRLEG